MLLWGSGKNLFIFSLLLTKIVSQFLIATIFVFFQSNKMFFYYNLGLTRLELFGSAFVIDMLVWSLAITLTALAS
jgi:hypothetical protein